jgi:hypothetical protein
MDHNIIGADACHVAKLLVKQSHPKLDYWHKDPWALPDGTFIVWNMLLYHQVTDN